MQEENEEKYSLPSRLKKIRVIKQWKWAEVAKALGLSEQMIYAVLAKRVGMSDKAIYRLSELERASGILNLGGGERSSFPMAEHTKSAPQKNTLAKLREQVQNMQTQLNIINETLKELE